MTFVDPTNCSGFRKYYCGFREIAYFGAIWSSTVFQVFVCGIQNSKENQKINVTGSATNLILASRGPRLQRTECLVMAQKE